MQKSRAEDENLTEATGSHPKRPSHEGGIGARKGRTLGTVEKAFHAALRQVDGGSEMGELQLGDHRSKPIVAPLSRDRIGSVHRLKECKHNGRETWEGNCTQDEKRSRKQRPAPTPSSRQKYTDDATANARTDAGTADEVLPDMCTCANMEKSHLHVQATDPMEMSHLSYIHVSPWR